MQEKFDYILGLDCGVQSIGWAVLPEAKRDFDKLKLGVRCFESGTGSESDIESGKDESRNTARRMARSIRRNLHRRSLRMKQLTSVLQKLGLLPACNVRCPEERNAMLTQLDQELAAFCAPDDRREAHLLPYLLRAKALDQKLPAHAVGRALYHLALRRGFKSNLKADAGENAEKEEGAVKAGISELEQAIEEAGCRTLGEFFSLQDPEVWRIRQHWTSREMHEIEFNAIWDEQAKYHKAMTPEAKKKVYRAIFFQRPLKSQRGKLGRCELESPPPPNQKRGPRRAPLACLPMQRFRYWQKILDLNYWLKDDPANVLELTREQQDMLAERLDCSEKVTFKELAKMLGFKPKDGVVFNLETGGEKALRGNITASRIAAIIPDRWGAMNGDEQERLVNEILQYTSESGLAVRLQKAFGFTPTEAAALSVVRLEASYASLSRRAIAKLLPVMIQTRRHYSEVRLEVYGSQKKSDEPEDVLPPLENVVGKVANPVVVRALSELRKVVNAIIRQYGKPKRIAIELGRNLKNGRKEREEMTKKMRDREKERDHARRALEEGGMIPNSTNILKYLLAVESDWRCPYTGKQISVETLDQFDIEHILPLSRSLDDSFMNKTLCDRHENRHVKRNLSPYEAYVGDETHYREILDRVKKLPKPKLERFLLQNIPSDFSQRMLNDTRYISRLAMTYLGTLYGGQIEYTEESETGKRKIFCCTGQATAWLRDEWDLNGILNSGRDWKTRTDHRHHAVDALAIACCNPKIVSQFAHAAELAEERDSHRRFERGAVEKPNVPHFLETIRRAVDEINVSYRSNHKVSGSLHEETNYSRKHLFEGVEYCHKRVALMNLKASDLEDIVDTGLRRLIEQKVQELGGDFKKFATQENLPKRNGIPVKQVRLRTVVTTTKIGRGPSVRHVKLGSNHHMEVIAILDANGNEVGWEGVVVTMLEAYQRRRLHQPVIQRDHGPGKRFKFSLVRNEFLLKTEDDGSQTLYRVFKMSKSATGAARLGWGKHTDARPALEVTNKTPGNTPTLSKLQNKIQKVTVDLLGNLHPAND